MNKSIEIIYDYSIKHTVFMVILAPKLSTQLSTRSTGPEFVLLPVLQICQCT